MMTTDTNTSALWIFVALVVAAMVIAAAITMRRRGRLRSAALRRRFGPEYDRALEDYGSPVRAERELSARTRRVEHLRFRELNLVDRARFVSNWSRIQVQFVDDPEGAVAAANALIKEVMHARGYPVNEFDQRVADLSVDHGAVVQHYRAARALSSSQRTGAERTEELRQAVVHFRALFADLLQEPGAPSQTLREVHA